MVKKFLDERDVAYVLRNVAEDVDAALEFRERGGRIPPLLVIGNTQVEGFKPARIEEALEAMWQDEHEVPHAH